MVRQCRTPGPVPPNPCVGHSRRDLLPQPLNALKRKGTDFERGRGAREIESQRREALSFSRDRITLASFSITLRRQKNPLGSEDSRRAVIRWGAALHPVTIANA